MKPGYQTTEWIATAITTIVSLLISSGVLDASGTNAAQKIAAGAVAFLSSAIYATLRTWLKARYNLSLPASADPSASPTGTAPISSAT